MADLLLDGNVLIIRLLSFPDALIAATALEYDPTLVTTNARHFPVAGLKVLEFPQL
jgi:predicted nucleic acid-binding protein